MILGVDISKKEVEHANKRLQERGLGSRGFFGVRDMEKGLPVPENTLDAVISNG